MDNDAPTRGIIDPEPKGHVFIPGDKKEAYIPP